MDAFWKLLHLGISQVMFGMKVSTGVENCLIISSSLVTLKTWKAELSLALRGKEKSEQLKA